MPVKQNEFVAHLLDLLSPLGGVTTRAMFGGWGFYKGGKMFALVAFDTFFVKADDENRAEFTNLGLEPFTYEMSAGKKSVMSYYQVPPDALDHAPLLCSWAEHGLSAAARAAVKKRPKKRA